MVCREPAEGLLDQGTWTSNVDATGTDTYGNQSAPMWWACGSEGGGHPKKMGQTIGSVISHL